MKATMRTFYEEPYDQMSCEVAISESQIHVSYKDWETGEIVVYQGEEKPAGVFILRCQARRGRAILHRSPDDSDLLHGSWYENGEEGMWSFELHEERPSRMV
jgi:hypothetical protein